MQGRVVAGALAVAFFAGCGSSGGAVPGPVPPRRTVGGLPPPVTPETSAESGSAAIAGTIRDLEARRLEGLSRRDAAALRPLYANDGYYRASLRLLEEVAVPAVPGRVEVAVLEVLASGPSCVAARVEIDNRATFGPQARGEVVMVLERTPGGAWGFSYEGRGWTCAGAHPLGS